LLAQSSKRRISFGLIEPSRSPTSNRSTGLGMCRPSLTFLGLINTFTLPPALISDLDLYEASWRLLVSLHTRCRTLARCCFLFPNSPRLFLRLHFSVHHRAPLSHTIRACSTLVPDSSSVTLYSLFLSFSLYLSIYLFIYLSIYLSFLSLLLLSLTLCIMYISIHPS